MLSGRVGTHNMAIIYIFIIYDIIVDRTRSLFSLSLDNGSYSSDVSRTVFFHRFYTLYDYVFVCDFFFVYISSDLYVRSKLCHICIHRRSIISMPFRNNSFLKKKMFVAISCILEYLIPAIPIILYNVLYLIMNIIYVV